MVTKNIQEITEEDLQSLIDNSVPEGKTIEYKQKLPGNSDSDKKEFLADVSSFGNASGGMIIYGIVEDKGSPKLLNGIDKVDIDSETRRLDSIIRAGIEPKLPSFNIKVVPLKNSKTAVIIQIARSWISPHRVVFQGHDKFYSRSSNGKCSLDVNELRNAFNLSETLSEKIRNFKVERIANIFADETPVPIKNNARIILHLIPYSAFIPDQRYEITSDREMKSELIPIYASGWDGRYNFDGYITYSGNPEQKYRSYTQFFRNGIIEAVEAFLLRPQDDGEEGRIPSVAYEKELISSLHR